jgi:hypothetical protein
MALWSTDLENRYKKAISEYKEKTAHNIKVKRKIKQDFEHAYGERRNPDDRRGVFEPPKYKLNRKKMAQLKKDNPISKSKIEKNKKEARRKYRLEYNQRPEVKERNRLRKRNKKK